jgi:tRNA A37 threonylcarbamoyladenosine dehydratase
MFERTIKLVGEENFKKITNTTVAVIGIGGVGGYAVEALIRSGISSIILVDYDTIEITNLNRQIISDQKHIGYFKVDEMEKRILNINPTCKITTLYDKLSIDNINILFKYSFDYLIDACDTISVKQELIKRCLKNNIKIISCMGTGNKLNPSMLEITDIKKTSYDPIAKKIRKYLKDNNINKKVPVVYSKEQNKKFEGSIPSLIFVPATAGLLCSNYVIKDIIETK